MLHILKNIYKLGLHCKMFSIEGYLAKVKYSSVTCNSYFILLLCLLTTDRVTCRPDTKQPFKLAQSADCGIADKSITDIRVGLPWIAAIYVRSPNSKSGYQFYLTGTIISETTVLTVAGGVFGAFPRGAKSKYFISPPNSYLIGVGLRSTNKEHADQFSQFSEVSYILPYNDHVQSNKHYHFLLFHLKTPLNFRTPHVKAICLPIFLRDVTRNLRSSKARCVQGGYAKSAQSDGSLPLTQFLMNEGLEEECSSLFRYYYKGSGSGDAQHIFCGRRADRDPGADNLCHSHGSMCMFSIQDRWYLTGITALIPAQKRGVCDRNTTYIYSREILYSKGKQLLDWLILNTKCSPDEFACKSGICIPLSSVCNLVPDCEDGADEDPTFCSAVHPCISSETHHACGVGGKCILKDQICDQKPDCADSSDESEAACAKVPGDILALQRSQRTCPPLNLTLGVVANCKNQITRDIVSCDGELYPGTVAVLTCDKYTTPLYSIATIELECDQRSKWKPSPPFSCETVCGEIKNTAPISSGRLPWSVALYRKIGGNYKLHCSATLIEPSFLLTSANCLSEAGKLNAVELEKFFKVVISPISNDFLTNSKDSVAQILNVKQIWISDSFNNYTQNWEVALMKLEKSVKLGGYVRPICYIQPSASTMPESGRRGKVSIFSNSNMPVPIRQYDFPVISHEACSKKVGSDFSSIFTFCAGFQNGTGLCGKNSGAGIYFQPSHVKFPKFVLEGVVTHGHRGSREECNANIYSIFTSVQVFEDWLVRILEKNS